MHEYKNVPRVSSELGGLGNDFDAGGVVPAIPPPPSPAVASESEGDRAVLLFVSADRGALLSCCCCCGCDPRPSEGAADFIVDQMPVILANYCFPPLASSRHVKVCRIVAWGPGCARERWSGCRDVQCAVRTCDLQNRGLRRAVVDFELGRPKW